MTCALENNSGALENKRSLERNNMVVPQVVTATNAGWKLIASLLKAGWTHAICISEVLLIFKTLVCDINDILGRNNIIYTP